MREHISLRAPLNKLFRHNFKHLLIFWIPCVLLLIAMMSVWVLMDVRSSRAQENSYVNKIAAHINDDFIGVRTQASLLACNRDVQAFLRESQVNLTDAFIKRLDNIQQQFILASVQYPEITSVTLHLNNPSYFVFHNSSYSHKGVYSRREETLILNLEAQEASSGWYLLDGDSCYFQRIVSNGVYQGCVLMRMSSSSISAAMAASTLDNNRRILLVDGTGRIIADTQAAVGQYIRTVYPEYQKGFSLLPNGPLFFSEDCDLPDCSLLIVSPPDRLGMRWTVTLGAILAAALVLLLLFVFLLYHATQSLCKPYETILALLNEPEVLSPDEYRKRYRSIDKLGMISTLIHKKSYQHMALKGELSEKERMLREAQNAMLQAQMNPHFLFNTLDNIYWMAMGELPEDNKVSSTIYLLSRLLRLSLQRGEPLTTVREEIEHARLYLEIQQIRMNNPFSIHWQVEEGLENCSMLCLSLQPLLENAISHGIKERTGGTLEVAIRSEDGILHVAVSDNGAGFTPEQLQQLNQRFLSPYETLREHIGLANIHARLKLVYGAAGELSVDSVPNQKTTVKMCFPDTKHTAGMPS